MTESIGGRLRTLLGNREAGDEPADGDRVLPARNPSLPSATQIPQAPPYATSPTLPPDADVLHDAPASDAPLADEPPSSPALPTDLPGARAYQAELQRKMTVLAEDFSLGKINRRQFEVVYTHYREQRQIIDALINSLNVGAWRKAISEGHTGLLLTHNAAQLLGYALYDQVARQPLAASPNFKVDAALITPIIAAHHTTPGVTPHINTSEIDRGRWLCFVPGRACTLVALFSVEPARAQLQLLQDLHHDFELANARRLAQGRGGEAAAQFMRLWALEQFI